MHRQATHSIEKAGARGLGDSARARAFRVPGRATRLAAMAVVALGAAPGLSAQGRYPASAPDAPAGVYAAPRLAIDSLDTLLRKDSLDYGANWRMSQAMTTLGALAGEAGRLGTRDSLFAAAKRYARRAIRIEPEKAEGHYMVAQLLLRTFAEVSLRDRAGIVGEAFASAQKAVELDPKHDGAWHELGRWHMEVWALSKLQRFVAIRFLGASVMEQASAEKGIEALEKAVSLRPNWIHHRLDLAKAYLNLERQQDAQAQLDALALLQPTNPEDHGYLREAARMSEWIASRN